MAKKRDKCIVCRRPLEPLEAGSAGLPLPAPDLRGLESIEKIVTKLHWEAIKSLEQRIYSLEVELTILKAQLNQEKRYV